MNYTIKDANSKRKAPSTRCSAFVHQPPLPVLKSPLHPPGRKKLITGSVPQGQLSAFPTSASVPACRCAARRCVWSAGPPASPRCSPTRPVSAPPARGTCAAPSAAMAGGAERSGAPGRGGRAAHGQTPRVGRGSEPAFSSDSGVEVERDLRKLERSRLLQ